MKTKTSQDRRDARLHVPVSQKEREVLESLRGDVPMAIFIRSLIRKERQRREQQA